MKHTPGPWHAFPLSEYWLIGEAPPKPGVHVGRAVTLPNAEANARLMAAAPELLSVLQDLSEVCGEATCLQAANLEVPNSVWRHMIALNAVAVQVIKKAKGEQ